MDQQQHGMILEFSHSSGMQGWHCPTCGRRILLLVPPNDDMIIVDLGNPNASHSGTTGGLRIGTVQVEEQKGDAEELSEESLRPWLKAIENLDLNL